MTRVVEIVKSRVFPEGQPALNAKHSVLLGLETGRASLPRMWYLNKESQIPAPGDRHGSRLSVAGVTKNAPS